MKKLLFVLTIAVFTTSVAQAATGPSFVPATTGASTTAFAKDPATKSSVLAKNLTQITKDSVGRRCNEGNDPFIVKWVEIKGQVELSSKSDLKVECCKIKKPATDKERAELDCNEDLKDATHVNTEIKFKIHPAKASTWLKGLTQKAVSFVTQDKSKDIFIDGDGYCKLSDKVITFSIEHDSKQKAIIKGHCGKITPDAPTPSDISGSGYNVPDGGGQSEYDKNRAEADKYEAQNRLAEAGAQPTNNGYAQQASNDPYGLYGDAGQYSNTYGQGLATVDTTIESNDGNSDEDLWGDDEDWEDDDYSSSGGVYDYGEKASEDEQYNPLSTQYGTPQEQIPADYYDYSGQGEYLSNSEIESAIGDWIGTTSQAGDISYEYIGFDFSEDEVTSLTSKYGNWESEFVWGLPLADIQYAYPNITQQEYDLMGALYAQNQYSWGVNWDNNFLDEPVEEKQCSWYSWWCGYYFGSDGAFTNIWGKNN